MRDLVVSIENNDLVFNYGGERKLNLKYSFAQCYEFDFDKVNSLWFTEQELTKLKNNFSFFNLLQDLAIQGSNQYTRLSIIDVQGRKFAVDLDALIGVKHTALKLDGRGIHDCYYPLSFFLSNRFHSVDKRTLFKFDKHVDSFLYVKAASVLWTTFTLQHLQDKLGFKIVKL